MLSGRIGWATAKALRSYPTPGFASPPSPFQYGRHAAPGLKSQEWPRSLGFSPQCPLPHPHFPAPGSRLRRPQPAAPITAPAQASAPAPGCLCCSRCHGDGSRENCHSLPRSSRAIGEVGSIPVWGWGCAAQLLSPSRLPVLGGGKEGGSWGAGPGEQPCRNRLGGVGGSGTSAERNLRGRRRRLRRRSWEQEQVRGWGRKAGPRKGEARGGG